MSQITLRYIDVLVSTDDDETTPPATAGEATDALELQPGETIVAVTSRYVPLGYHRISHYARVWIAKERA